MSPMRLCILTTSFPRHAGDDAGVFVKRLVEAFSAQGASGVVLVPRAGEEAVSETVGQFQVQRFSFWLRGRRTLAFGAGIMPNLRRKPWLAVQIPFLIGAMTLRCIRLRGAYDCVHANWLGAGVGAWLAHLVTAKPYVITLRGEDVKLVQARWLAPLVGVVLRGAYYVVTVNNTFREIVEERFRLSREKTLQIANGVAVRQVTEAEVEGFRARHALKLGAPVLVSVGRVIALKRVEALVRLLTAPELSACELVICGVEEDVEYSRSLRDEIARHDLGERVHFLGRISPTEVPLCLALGDVFASASSYEGRPNAVMEALAAGKVCFVSDILGHQEIIEDGENGFLFDPENLEASGKRIARVYADLNLREKISQAARESVREFSWDTCARRYLEIFRESALAVSSD